MRAISSDVLSCRCIFSPSPRLYNSYIRSLHTFFLHSWLLVSLNVHRLRTVNADEQIASSNKHSFPLSRVRPSILPLAGTQAIFPSHTPAYSAISSVHTHTHIHITPPLHTSLVSTSRAYTRDRCITGAKKVARFQHTLPLPQRPRPVYIPFYNTYLDITSRFPAPPPFQLSRSKPQRIFVACISFTKTAYT